MDPRGPGVETTPGQWQGYDHNFHIRYALGEFLGQLCKACVLNGIVMPLLVYWLSPCVNSLLQSWKVQIIALAATVVSFRRLLSRLVTNRNESMTQDLLLSLLFVIPIMFSTGNRGALMLRFKTLKMVLMVSGYLLQDLAPAIGLYVDQQRADIESLVEISLALTRVLCFTLPWKVMPLFGALVGGIGLLWVIRSTRTFNTYRTWLDPEKWTSIYMVCSSCMTHLGKIAFAWGRIGSFASDPRFPEHQETLAGLPRLQPQPLKAREIRLLEIQRKRMLKAPQCRILSVSVDDAPPYEAISHAWEYPVQYVNVVANEQFRIEVPSRLYQFLCHRQSYFGPKLVWIDALCINQEDMDERAKQVKMMKDVFGRATSVVVWLAGPDEVTDATLVRNHLWYMRLVESLVGGSQTHIDSTYSSGATYEALKRLLRQRWFKRVWMVQEIALANRVIILYGSVSLDWWELDCFVTSISNPQHWSTLQGLTLPSSEAAYEFNHLRSGPNIIRMSRFRNNVRNDKRYLKLRQFPSSVAHISVVGGQQVPGTIESYIMLSLENVFHLTSGFDATDPRDKIFALLGTIQDPAARLPDPDYRSTFEDIYLRTCVLLLTTGQHPGVSLSLAGIGLRSEGLLANMKSPSWTPNYISQMILMGHVTTRFDITCKVNIAICEDHRSLRVRACITDRIRHIGPISRTPAIGAKGVTLTVGSENTVAKDMASWVLETRRFAQRFIKDGQEAPTKVDVGKDSQKRFDEASFWRTIFANQYAKLFPIPEETLAFMTRNFRDTFNELLERDAFPVGLWPHAETEIYQTLGPSLAETSLGRRFAVSQKGMHALVPPFTKDGDVICMFEGLPQPFLLRAGDSGSWQLVGACYVDDFKASDDGFEKIVII